MLRAVIWRGSRALARTARLQLPRRSRYGSEVRSHMGKSVRLCVASTVYIFSLLASHGLAMTQQHSKPVDIGVIFSAEQLERLAKVRDIGVTPPYWTPSSEEIAQLEVQLKPYLEGATRPEAKVIARRLESYKRQYLGFTHGGVRWILVNSF